MRFLKYMVIYSLLVFGGGIFFTAPGPWYYWPGWLGLVCMGIGAITLAFVVDD